MAIQDITKYTYKNIFSLSVVKFDKACIMNEQEQIDAYSIYWIKKGSGKYHIDFESYSFNSNVLFFLSPGQVFSVENEAIEEAYKLTFLKDFYCIQTHDKEVACNGVLFNNIYDTPFLQPSERDILKLDFIITSLVDELKQSETGQYDMLQAYLKQFIVYSVRIKKEHYQIKDDVASQLFKDFSTLVEQNYKTIHSVSEYATRLGISPKSLTKHFQKIGSQTPSNFIKNRVILEAKRQLLYSSDSVKQIAFNLGYNDPAYFTRFFTKSTSKSPLHFKTDYKK